MTQRKQGIDRLDEHAEQFDTLEEPEVEAHRLDGLQPRGDVEGHRLDVLERGGDR